MRLVLQVHIATQYGITLSCL